jgi:hypothetical protein
MENWYWYHWFHSRYDYWYERINLHPCTHHEIDIAGNLIIRDELECPDFIDSEEFGT